MIIMETEAAPEQIAPVIKEPKKNGRSKKNWS